MQLVNHASCKRIPHLQAVFRVLYCECCGNEFAQVSSDESRPAGMLWPLRGESVMSAASGEASRRVDRGKGKANVQAGMSILGKACLASWAPRGS